MFGTNKNYFFSRNYFLREKNYGSKNEKQKKEKRREDFLF